MAVVPGAAAASSSTPLQPRSSHLPAHLATPHLVTCLLTCTQLHTPHALQSSVHPHPHPTPTPHASAPTGYMSRSVAGSYDNEAVAIFALLTTFYLFVRAVRLGSVSSAAAAAVGYLYMAASWGAYVFISNLIPLYILVLIVTRRYHRRAYVAYTTFWALGGPLAMQARGMVHNILGLMHAAVGGTDGLQRHSTHIVTHAHGDASRDRGMGNACTDTHTCTHTHKHTPLPLHCRSASLAATM